ncbi:MAG: putative PIF1 helicase [Streblomastix strix]|uniref:Putative PIF1 helicase n=1 Tax=Streblomastix strix TaxID=222440 RepID=A0A5J4SP15_9EUKA|nr:MAG: putative PIF1 helicase [Streblomastix strix]
MALQSRFKKPDIFITITANPQWREIRENCDGMNPSHRPDIIVRVFYQKFMYLLHLITVEHIFGVPVCWVYQVEFQKRGLPHVHLLITLREQDKIYTPEQLERLISAEIPDSSTSPNLRKSVIQFMIHGPCGELNPNSP